MAIDKASPGNIRHTKTVLVIVAHADDMEFMAGGTIAFAEGFRRQRFGGIERRARELGAELPDDV